MRLIPTRTRTRWLLGLVAAWVLIGCSMRPPAPHYASGLGQYHIWPPAPLEAPAKEAVARLGGPRLPHDIHADNDIGCTDCHQIDEETGRPSMPTWDGICSMCHEDMDEEFEKDEEKVQNRFFDEDGNARWKVAIQPYGGDLKWAHKPHAKLENACKTCHAYMLEPLEETPTRPQARLFGMAACEKCHSENKAPTDCKTCHEKLDRQTPPPTHENGEWRKMHGRTSMYLREAGTAQNCSLCHDEPQFCNDCHHRTKPADHTGTGWRMLHGQVVRSAGRFPPKRCQLCHTSTRECDECHRVTKPRDHAHMWKKRHGQMVRAEGADFPFRCAMCHSDRSYCERCHKDEEPASHTTLFRTRTHGMLAAMDRRTCATCHTTPFCERCHQNTAPRSHRAGWAMGRNTHCVSCHFPISMAPGCSACHQGNPTHDVAPMQPMGHIPGRNCRVCHNAIGQGGAKPLRHVDNGMNCEFCHH